MMRSSMQRVGMMDPSARIEQRLNQFKGELKLNAQQEPLWQAFAEKSKTEAGKGMQAMRERMKDEKALTAPERMAQMQSEHEGARHRHGLGQRILHAPLFGR
jgi:hypothetical protein